MLTMRLIEVADDADVTAIEMAETLYSDLEVDGFDLDGERLAVEDLYELDDDELEEVEVELGADQLERLVWLTGV